MSKWWNMDNPGSMPTSLTSLYAAHNLIAHLSANANDEQSQQIRHLQLAGNQLATLSATMLPDSLETANFSANALQVIAPGTLRNKSQLKWIDVRANMLTMLSANAFDVDDNDAPMRIYASDNRFECSCEMDWIRKQRSVSADFEYIYL